MPHYEPMEAEEMIRMHNIPVHIQTSLKDFYKENEKPDVFPSKFKIDGKTYYYFTFSPIAEQLIMEENGTVPSFHSVKKEALIFNSYNSSIESIASIGNRWVKSNKRNNYEKLKILLADLKEKLPIELATAHDTYVKAAETILENQAIIEHSVKRATDIWQRTNHKELVTEDDQIEMRKYTYEIGRAGYQQNVIQLETENEREKVWNYVSSNAWSVGWGFYFKLKPFQKNMMKNTPENIRSRRAREIGTWGISSTGTT